MHFFKGHLSLPPSETVKLLTFFIALHDIGKFSDGFQKLNEEIAAQLGRNNSKKTYTQYHDALGLFLWQEIILNQCIQEDWFGLGNTISLSDRSYFDSIINPIFGHHGYPVSISEDSFTQRFTDDNSKDTLDFTSELAQLLLKSDKANFDGILEKMENFQRHSWWLAGFTSLCDWIGSNSEYFEFKDTYISLNEYWESIALPSAKKAAASIGLWGIHSSTESSFSDFFPKINTPTPLQKELSEIDLADSPQIFILEDIMGAGKTEAALILAHRLMAKGLGEGVYIGLPTMATSNAMYDRIETVYRKFFDTTSNPSLVLAHGSADLHDQFQSSIWNSEKNYLAKNLDDLPNDAYCSAWVSDNRKKALLSHFGVGTIDQPLLAILIAKYQGLRLFGLRNKILILDEVHASDAYVHTLTQQLLKSHAAAGGSVILLSATLPKKMKEELLNSYKQGLEKHNSRNRLSLESREYPLVTTFSGEMPKEISVSSRESVIRDLSWTLFNDQEGLISQLLSKIIQGQCGAWICNTITDAIELYNKIKAHFPDLEVILFHARFAMGDRLSIENKVKGFFGKTSTSTIRTNKLVIATQVIEQSMDLDFDWMVTDLCPIDLIIQRAGRLRRHTRTTNGNPHDFNDERGIPELWIHSPTPYTDCPTDWYQSKFKSASFVYEDHAQLWLTARYIYDRPVFHIPADLRDAIETVFSDDSLDQFPVSLQKSSTNASGTTSAARQNAKWNMINLDSGYMPDDKWEEDIYVPTRLSKQKMITIRLAKWENGKIYPWITHANQKKAWALSEVSISEWKITKEAKQSDAIDQAIKALKDSWPGKPEFYFVLPLSKSGQSEYAGTVINKSGKLVCVKYSAEFGLVSL